MTEERLAELERIADAATKGPWAWMSSEPDIGDVGILRASCNSGGMFHEGLGHSLEECGATVLFCENPIIIDRDGTSDGRPEPKDAEFIAVSRTAVPELIAEVRRLRELLMKAEFTSTEIDGLLDCLKETTEQTGMSADERNWIG